MSRIEAAAAERRKAAQRKRTLTAAGVAVVVLLIVVVALVARGGDSKAKVATGADAGTASGASTTVPTSTTAAALASVADKPCVAVSDPLPAGAPEVPVKVGPPPTELIHEDLKEGNGAEVTAASKLTVNYIGVSCSSGKIFDSSYSRGQPATFSLSAVIKGWQDGLPGMKVGGQRLLGIPAAQAYGSQGRPPTIAPDESLWFVVEVLDAT